MNAASAVVLLAVLALAGLAVWRRFRKGSPCSCGCGGKNGKCDCRCCH